MDGALVVGGLILLLGCRTHHERATVNLDHDKSLVAHGEFFHNKLARVDCHIDGCLFAGGEIFDGDCRLSRFDGIHTEGGAVE